MFAAITLLKLLPGRAEGAAELFGSLVMPAYAERSARGAWIFTHPEDNRAMVIVMYDTREAAEAREEKDAVEAVMEAHCDTLAEPPRREVFYVAMGTMSGPPPPALAPLSGDILSLLAEVSSSL
ncbi:MAG: hypothetical protein M3328_15250 [Chloroflexota bacterium]|nr:hypothetical protein [Chloroflexota bacterium]